MPGKLDSSAPGVSRKFPDRQGSRRLHPGGASIAKGAPLLVDGEELVAVDILAEPERQLVAARLIGEGIDVDR